MGILRTNASGGGEILRLESLVDQKDSQIATLTSEKANLQSQVNETQLKLSGGFDIAYYTYLGISSSALINLSHGFNSDDFTVYAGNNTTQTASLKANRNMLVCLANASETSGSTCYCNCGKKSNGTLELLRKLYKGYNQSWGVGPMPNSGFGFAIVLTRLKTGDSLEFYNPGVYSSAAGIQLLIGLIYI